MLKNDNNFEVKKVTSKNIDASLVVLNNPASPATENIKVLRTHILRPKDGKLRKVICVTSSAGKEGKTFIATNLAVSIAQSFDPYALLIDADLRRSKISKIFGLPSDLEGLSSFLQDPVDVGKYLVKTDVSKLTILPAGPSPENPSELLTSSKMENLLKEVRDRYPDRYIILDSPPVNLASETMALVQESDGVILVIRYGFSNKVMVKDAVEKIGRDKIIGVVFNSVEIMTKSYSRYIKEYY